MMWFNLNLFTTDQTNSKEDTDMSLFEADHSPPEPEELPYNADMHHISHTNSYEPLVESVDAALDYLQSHGEAQTDDISVLMDLPRNGDVRGWTSEKWYFLRVAPVLASHPDVEWHDSYRFNPANALPESELADFARSEWDLPERAVKTNRGYVQNPRALYPKVLGIWYRMVRDRHNEHGVGVPKFELVRQSLVSERHSEQCLEYFETVPGIIPSAYETGADKPDWELIGDEPEAETQADTSEESHA